ncbi:MAG: hypothetical protein RL038_554 [Actinomycetota bacterium]
MSFKNRLARLTAVLIAVSISFSVAPSAQAANPKGLFGQSDPTYDGVFRQSLAIMSLVAAGSKVPPAAQLWLVKQQCPNGGFEAFRADTDAECNPSDAVNYSGIETNSTALAAVALAAIGKPVKARKAVEWLKSAQRGSGGIPYFKGGTPDAASTALALIAAKSVGLDQTAFAVGEKNLVSFLRTVMLDCGYEKSARGALAYSKSNPLFASPMTTSQALAALSGALQEPVKTAEQPRSMICPEGGKPTRLQDIRNANASFIASTLTARNGVMPSEYGSGDDWGSTAWAVIGLAGSGYSNKTYSSAVIALRNNLNTALAYSNNEVNPGRAALVILAVKAAGLNPAKFGNKNLLAELRGTLN